MDNFRSTYQERKGNRHPIKAVVYLKEKKIQAHHSGGSVFIQSNGLELMLDNREVKKLALCWERDYKKQNPS